MNLTLLGRPTELEKFSETSLLLRSQYSAALAAEVAELEGVSARGSGCWSIKDSPRNWFSLDILTNGAVNGWSNRYSEKARPKCEVVPVRNFEWCQKHDIRDNEGNIAKGVWSHQLEMITFDLTRLQDINAGEMGTGKTLAKFEAIEHLRYKLKLNKGPLWWVAPKSALTALWTQMSKWKFYLQWGDRVFNYAQLEKEMDQAKQPPQILVMDESQAVKRNQSRRTQLAIQLGVECDRHWGEDSARYLMTGTPSPESHFDWWTQCEIVRPGWLREASYAKFERRMATFGFEDKPGGGSYPVFQDYKAAEVAKLPNRLSGLVQIWWKKDCMDLPEKLYEVIECQPDAATLRVARLLTKRFSGAELQQKLRQLSDGFQYVSQAVDDDTSEVVAESEPARTTQVGLTPKDQVLRDLLEEYTPHKRFVVYAAYEASVDRCVSIAREAGWKVWRYDGRGQEGGVTEEVFTDYRRNSEPICFVGNPEAAGAGLTLSGSPAICYYSNSFKGVYRTQSEDRIHRPGATRERGCKIYDIVHLPTDKLVIERVKAKRDAEVLTLQEIAAALGEGRDEEVR